MDKIDLLGNFYTKSVGLIYFSCQKTASFSSYGSIVTEINKSLNKDKTNVYNLFLWGDFDFMSIIYTSSTKELINLARITPGIGPGIKSFSIKLGTLLYNDPSFYDDLSGNNLPIKIVMSIKCNKSFIKCSRGNYNHHNDVNSFFLDFISLCVSLKENILTEINLPNGVLSFQIIAPYSWEDFIVILNSNSLEIIKRFLVSIREATFDKAKSGRRHLLFSSNSVIGFPLFYPSSIEEYIPDKSLNLIDNDIHWSIKIRIRPGHANWVLNYFLNTSKDIFDFNIHNLIGTYDIIIQSKHRVSFKSFLRWYFNELSPNLKLKNSAILAIKTDFMLDFDIADPIEPHATQPDHFNYLNESLRVKGLAKDFLPEHVLSALVSIGSTFEYLVSQHTTISKEFRFTSDAYILFLKTVEHDIISDIYLLNDHEKYPVAIQNIADIIEEFSYIFGERFRGGHPVGKTLSELPTVTYSGSFHKILQGIEAVINDILIESGEFVQKYCYQTYKQYTSICCRIRNIDSPCYTFQLKNAFIHFPLDTLLFQENWYYIMHELGHILMEELFLLLAETNPQQRLIIEKERYIIPQIKELFADSFALSILFKGDVDSYMNFVKSYCERIMKWNIPEITFEFRKALLNIFNGLKDNGKMRIKSGVLNPVSQISLDDKLNILKLIRKINKLVNSTDILIWLSALKMLKLDDDILTKLVQISQLANKFYFGPRETKAVTHIGLHKMRREIIHQLWFRSVVN